MNEYNHSTNNIALNQWMTHLPESVRELPVNRLTLPGTHDSAAYSIDFSNPLGQSSILFKIVNIAAQIFSCIAKIITDWTLTQDKSIREQLDIGVRQLDLRVSLCQKTNQFFLLHSFTCIPLEKALIDISDFLNTNEGEVIILNMKSDWPHRAILSTETENKLFNSVQRFLGESLCKKTPDSQFDDSMSLKQLIERGERVIFSYGKHAVEETDTLAEGDFNWSRNSFDTPWPDSSNIDQVINEMKKNVTNDLEFSPKKINGLSFTLTPQLADVISDIFKRVALYFTYQPKGVKALAGQFKEEINLFLEEHKDQIRSKITVIATDFVDEDFTRAVIQMNDFS